MEIGISKLVGLRIPIEGYLVMFCLYNEENEVLSSYTKNVSQIPTKVFKDLIDQGYITSTAENDEFTVENIELTDRFKYDVLKVPKVSNLTFDEAFEQLREYYPSKVPSPDGGDDRRLQGDVDRCKKYYKNIILSNGEVDEYKHKTILQCITYEVASRKKGRKGLGYMAMLATYLNKKGWDVYQDDVKQLVARNGSIDDTTDGFTEDI